MVILVLTRAGWQDVERLITQTAVAVWVNRGVLSETEVGALRGAGTNLTSFSHIVDGADQDSLVQALQTIAEHHPGQRVWLELPLSRIPWITGGD